MDFQITFDGLMKAFNKLNTKLRSEIWILSYQGKYSMESGKAIHICIWALMIVYVYTQTSVYIYIHIFAYSA